MAQAYNRTPSELYGIAGAAGFCFDTGIFLFANWVENECQEAENRASNEMFARSNRARAFARCMGDDMENSTAGFADPFARDGMGGMDEVDPLLPGNNTPGGTGKRRHRPKAEQDQVEDEILGGEDVLDDLAVSYGA